MWLVGAFALCFFAGGWILWRGSYREYLDTGFSYWIPLWMAGVAFALSWLCGAGFIPSWLVIGWVFPAIVFARVVLDGMQDPTSHNLWPIEAGVAVIESMGIVFPGALIGALLRRLTHRNRSLESVFFGVFQRPIAMRTKWQLDDSSPNDSRP
jgi:hypothetical protein